MNVIMLLKNKEHVAYLTDTDTVAFGLNKMREHKYSAIPVLTQSGHYAGCISEGDFLWSIADMSNEEKEKLNRITIREIMRSNFNPPARISITMEELLKLSMNQNFIPIVDDRNFFIGIVTRQDIIGAFVNK